MAKIRWQLSGDYFETCSCDYVCPCIPSAMAARPTKGSCTFAFAFHVGKGDYGKVKLAGLNFAVVGQTPGAMGLGNWSVGLIIDERAKPDQEQAITGIASGQAGGPMAALAPLIGKFLGAERRPIRFEKMGLRRTVSIPKRGAYPGGRIRSHCASVSARHAMPSRYRALPLNPKF